MTQALLSTSPSLETATITIQGIQALTPEGWRDDVTVMIEQGRFTALGQSISTPNGTVIDGRGLQMLPGIVDIHGDAFERMISPRPGVHFPLSIALLENDRNLLATGITTFFYSITDSYEPGLRSRESARAVIEFVLGEGKQMLRCNSRIHIRHELANTADHAELCDWLESGRVHLLSLNDHLPPAGDRDRLARHLKGLRLRLPLPESDLIALLAQAEAQREQGYQQVEQLVNLAHQCRIPLASHDDDTEEKVRQSQQRQVAIAEFPATVALAAQSRAYGAAVLMGAPNLVRGGSHIGWMSVAEAAEQGVLDCLCSDYHYPSLLHAPFLLHNLGLMPFEQAWSCVSSRPAIAAGLGDRKGAIAPGFDADFLLMHSNAAGQTAIASVYVAGREVARYATR
jgi:alpha-D-ribose 1-methylphosphonate 5-triphosphate diphosphatase